MRRRVIWPALLASAALGHGALAQTSSGIVAPDRPDQNAAPRTAAGMPSTPRGLDASALRARNPTKPFAPFTLTAVTIDGASLPRGDLASAWAPFIGKPMDLATLDRLVDAVGDRYARSDVALYTVLVPEQDFAGGVVKLQAVEGYLQGARLDGVSNRKRSALVGRYLAPLLKERPLSKASLQRKVSLIRDMPGLYPQLSFERGDKVGAVQLVITARPRLAQFGFGVDNQGTALLGQTQAQAELYLNSLLVGGDQLHGTIATPVGPNLFNYFALSYAAPINANGTTLQASAGYLQTRPSEIPLRGRAVSLGLQVSHPIVRGFRNTVYLTAGIDGVNSDNALLGQTFTHENVRTGRIGAAWSRTTNPNVLTLSGTLSVGLPGLGAREFDPGLSQMNFTKLNIKAAYSQLIGRDFILRLDSFYQLSRDRLPISEQLALGGEEFGRAYEAAIISGDRGAAGSAEIAWRPTHGLPPDFKGSEAFAFADAGEATSLGRFGLPDHTARIASVGGGVRADIKSHVVVQVEAARGLTNPVTFENREDWRLLASLRTLF
jgi:hemolysin activation/secretion protein